MTTIRAGCAAALLLLLLSAAAEADNETTATSAASWLESAQADDGSWGGDPEVRAVYTTEAVNALRAFGWKHAAHYRGLAWVENHSMSSVDLGARRIVALAANGDNVSRDLDLLYFNFSFDSLSGYGWGISAPYVASPLDTALALLAQAELGVPHFSDTLDGLNFLLNTQAVDGGWPIDPSGSSDPIVTSLALRAYASLMDTFTGFETSAEAAAAYLLTNVDGTNTALVRALAARALLAWYPGTTDADGLLASLESSQLGNGSWGDDAYATAAALHAFATRLGRDAPNLQEMVYVPDLGLRAAINLALGKNRVDALTRGELQGLTALDAAGFGIEDLTGIEEAINLAMLDLTGNIGITDFSPLDSLANLVDLTLPAMLCDVDQDGVFTVADALLTLRATTGAITLTPTQSYSADVAPTTGPGDGSVNVGDAVVVMRALAGLDPVCGD